MNKLIFISIFILFGSNLLSAQESDQSYAHKSKSIARSKEGLGLKSFDINKGEATVKIKWDSGKFEYQLIYQKAPAVLEHYIKDTFPRDNIAKIIFLDGDGFKITERYCFVRSFSYDKEGQNLVCRNSSDDDRLPFSVEEYRKISGAVALINQNPAN